MDTFNGSVKHQIGWERKKHQLAQQWEQEAVLKATAVRSPLPVIGNVIDSSLSSLSGRGEGGLAGEGEGGWGQGIFHPPRHVLHHHMVLHPKGTSHKNTEDNAAVKEQNGVRVPNVGCTVQTERTKLVYASQVAD